MKKNLFLTFLLLLAVTWTMGQKDPTKGQVSKENAIEIIQTDLMMSETLVATKKQDSQVEVPVIKPEVRPLVKHVSEFSTYSKTGNKSTVLISPTGDGGFENGTTPAANNWTAVNSSTDGWFVGTGTAPSAGERCGYISSTGGATWAYSQVSTIQHLFYDVTVPAGETILVLNFKWKAGGEGGTTSDWDNMKVFFGLQSSISPVANTAIGAAFQRSGPGAISGMYKLNSATWQNETITLTGLVPGSVYRLVFSWKSDVSDIVNPPAAVDEITLRTPVAPAAPITFLANAVSQTGMTINWVDNSDNETGFRVYSSTDGIDFIQHGANVPSTTVGTTGTDYSLALTGLIPGTTYHFRVVAYGEVESAALVGTQATDAGVEFTTAQSGAWSDTETWTGGVVPGLLDNATITATHVVTLSADASCNFLTINGTLDINGAALLTSVDVTVGVDGTVKVIAGTSGGLVIRRNAVNNGIMDFYESATIYGRITFDGTLQQIFTNNGTLDVGTMIVQKTARANVAEMNMGTNFTIKGGIDDGFLLLTAGTLKLSGNAVVSNKVFLTAAYTIGATAGFWLNAPNFSVSGQLGSPTNSGLFRLSQGTVNIGTSSGNSLGGAAGAVFTIEGGTLNLASRFQTTSAITLNLTGGVINVNLVGNTAATASFGLTAAANTINISGGVINLVQRSTNAAPLDYSVSGTFNITGGTLNVGTAATATNFDFRIIGTTPNLVITNDGTPKSVLLTGATNVRGNLTVTSGTTLNAATTGTITIIGNSNQPGNIVNDGIITTAVAARIDISGQFGPQTYSGSGVFGTTTTPFNMISCGNPNGLTVNAPIITARINLFTGLVTNSTNIILGNGVLTSVIVQRGGNPGAPAGEFDVTPTVNEVGIYGYNILYSQAIASYSTGVELMGGANRRIQLGIVAPINVVLSNPVSVSYLILTATNIAKLITTSSNLLTVTGEAGDIVTQAGNTGYIQGPLARVLPASLAAGTTYAFPVGKGTLNQVDIVDPVTNAGGTVTILAEVFDENPGGTLGAGLAPGSMGDRYWNAQVTNGAANFTNAKLKVTQAVPALTATSGLIRSATLTGVYETVSPAAPVANALTSSVLTEFGYFTTATKLLSDVTITVTDGTDPVATATVQIVGQTALTTNASGVSTITLPYGTYNYTVTKAGFYTYTGTFAAEEATTPVNVVLVSLYAVNFTVTNSEAAAIAAASILITGDITVYGMPVTINQTLTTNASGLATANFPAGTLNYVVSKIGYTSATGSFTVINAIVDVPTIVMADAPPTLTISPATCAFPATEMNVSATPITVTLTNIGMGTLTINPGDVTITGADAAQFGFTPLAVTANLTVGQTATFPVTFTPTTAGTFSAVLEVNDNQGKGIKTIPITGSSWDATIYTLPYVQSFDALPFPQQGWTNLKIGGTGTPGVFDRQTVGTYPDVTPKAGAAMIRYNAYNLASGTNGILASPRISFDDQKYAVTFWMYRDNGYLANADKVEVLLNVNANLTGAELLGTVNRSISLTPVVTANGWYKYQFAIPASYNNSFARVILSATSAFGNNIFVDELAVEKLYTLTLVSSNIDAGTVTGTGNYLAGTVVNVVAASNPGFTFYNWTNEANVVLSTNSNFAYTTTDQNVTLTANFIENREIIAVADVVDISVEYLTSLEDVNLPETVMVDLDGEYFGETTVELDINWNGGVPAYNGAVAGDYVFTGTLVLEPGILNAAAHNVSLTVTVEKGNPVVTTWPVALNEITYGATLADADLTGVTEVDVPGGFSFVDETIVPEYVDGGYEAAVVFIPTDGDNYNNLVGTVLVTVNKLDVNVVGAMAHNKVYDGNEMALVTGATLDGILLADIANVALNASGPNFYGQFVDAEGAVNVVIGTNINVVTPTMTISGSASHNYNLILPDYLTADITAKELTVINAVAQSKVYDKTTVAVVTGAVLDGIVGTDDVVLENATEGLFEQATVGTDLEVTVAMTLAGADIGNYTLTQPDYLAADITVKELTVINAVASDKIYDRTTDAVISGAQLTGVETGDVVVLGNHEMGTFSQFAVGQNLVVSTTMNITGDDAFNYNLVQPGYLTADINKRPINVIADNQIKKSGLVFTFEGDEFTVNPATIEPDAVTSVTLTSDGSAAGALANEDPGYAVVISAAVGSGLDNYDITYVNGTMIVTDKIIVNLPDLAIANKIYDGTRTATVSNWGTLSGIDPEFPNVNFDATAAIAEFATAGAGSNKTVTITGVALTGSDATLYKLATLTPTATITKKELDITAENKTKVYGNADPSLTVTYNGFVAGQNQTNLGGALVVSRETGENVGPYVITPSGYTSANYEINFVNGNFTITQRSLAVAAQAKTKVYGQVDPALTYQITSGTLAFTDAFAGALTREVGEGIGNREIQQGTLTIVRGGDNVYTNYNFAYTPANLAITAKPLSVINAVAQSKVYDKTTAAIITGAALSGVVTGDNVTLENGTVGTFAQATVGNNLAVSINMSISGDVANYTFTQPVGLTANITAKPLAVINAVAENKLYDGTTAAVISGAELNGVIAGDVVALNNATVGTFAQATIGSGVAVTTNMNISGADVANYTLTGQPTGLTANIAPVQLTIGGSFTASNKLFDGTVAATINPAGLTVVGVVSGQTVTLTNVVAEFASPNVGTGITVSIVSAQLAGTTASNYTLSLVGAPIATANIYNEFALTLVANPVIGGTINNVAGNYQPGSVINLIATPAAGYSFTNWTNGATVVSTVASFAFTMPSEAVTLTANFELIPVYALTLVANPVAGGTITGTAGNYPAGAQINLNATPAAGYSFVNWTNGAVLVSATAQFVFTMPAEAVTLTANFNLIPVYNVTFTVVDGQAGPLAGANVAINGQNLTTDAQGIAVVNGLINGTYPYVVSKADYVNATGDAVVAGANLPINVVLNDVIVAPFNVAAAVINGNSALVNWNTVYNYSDDVESYDNFITSGIGEYTLVDVDGSATYSITGATFPNQGYVGSYIVFNPSAVTPALTTAQWQPNGGSKYLACFAATSAVNNDWLISPQMPAAPGMVMSFWAKSVVSTYGLERMKVGVSTTGTAPADFTFITPAPYVQVPTTWTQYTYNLSAYAGQQVYLAINCVSNDAYTLMIDDIFVGTTKTPENKGFLGYTLYLNDAVHVTGLTGTEYTITELPVGDHIIGLQSVYSSGSSAIVYAEPITVYPSDFAVSFTVTSNDAPISGALITINSQELTTDATGVAALNLPNGTYVYTVSKLGYNNATGSVIVNNAVVNQPVSMTLAPFATTFSVTSQGAPLAGVAIIVNGSVFLTTNAQGTVIGNFVNGSYTFVAAKTGYDTYNGEFVVNNATQTVSINMLVGIDGVAENYVRLYPNPVSDVLNIERNSSEEVVVELYSNSGSLINSFKTENVTTTFDVTTLGSGSYFIRIIGTSSTTIHRFIKQ